GGALIDDDGRGDIAFMHRPGRAAEPGKGDAAERRAVEAAVAHVPDITTFTPALRGTRIEAARAAPVTTARAEQVALQVPISHRDSVTRRRRCGNWQAQRRGGGESSCAMRRRGTGDPQRRLAQHI